MTNKITIILAAATALLFSSCEKDKPYDHPFVYIIQADDAAYAATSTVSSQATVVRTYNICLSSKELSENLIVDYSFNVGDGLKAGIDFERVTTGNQIVFVPGVYSMPIRIRWLPNEIDPLKDNTITIRIENTSLGFTVGFPGPDQLSRQHTIRKINM
ncbi:MAG: hypothetical protein KHX48_04255 [Alistipes sp.]|uniref:DUF1735 domain-containing protein n=1 Tax=Alistipes intestinihominis TaxID=3133172 RepID=A0ABV1GXF1_9BACT|nr:hypothetical protein [Alistipes sp.]